MSEETQIMVSIRCITYNHEPYIRQCLEGFVMQKTNFKFEAIVHDDASIDGTAAIIREYAEKYSDIIKPLYETENQYSKHDGSLSRILNAHTRGKYVAICEGDDYWTDPYKLQKQVDFLEANPDYSLCFSNVKIKFENGVTDSGGLLLNIKEGDYSICQIYSQRIIATCSILYRYCQIENNKNVIYGDIFCFLQLAERGKVYCMKDVTTIYRRHKGGASVTLSTLDLMRLYDQYDFFIKRFPDLEEISKAERNRYLELLKYVNYERGVWRYRVKYIAYHPNKILSKYLFNTIKYMIWDIIDMHKQ